MLLLNTSFADDLRDNLPKRPLIIEDDMGGFVSEYNQRYKYLYENHVPVIIKGECASACARYMKLPGVCAAPHAYFSFHAIWRKVGEIFPEESRLDSLQTDNAAAFAIEKKYDTFHMGFVKKRPYVKRTIAPGIRMTYTVYRTGKTRLYQQMLEVDASRVIPVCKTIPK